MLQIYIFFDSLLFVANLDPLGFARIAAAANEDPGERSGICTTKPTNPRPKRANGEAPDKS